MLKEPITKKCCVCGKEFSTLNPRKLYCSEDCKRTVYEKKYKKTNKRYNRDKTEAKDYVNIDPMPFDILKYAYSKPKGVSDIRWRIELRRREQGRSQRMYFNGKRSRDE